MKKLSVALGAAVIALAGAFPQAGHAAERPSCGYEYLSPFSLWGDDGLYGLAPSGSFEEGAAGWELSEGAAVTVPGSGLRVGSELFSLSLPAGSSATSPPICIQPGSPWARVFAHTWDARPDVRRGLRVSIRYTDSVTGRKTTRPVAKLAQQPVWGPTRRLALGGPLSVKPGNSPRKPVRFVFTPLHGTSWSIDDLFIDPKRR
jgi:hypothetical protein